MALSLRVWGVIGVCVAAGVLAWQQPGPLRAWVASAQQAAAPAPAPLRKCVNGQQVSYTNVDCPVGHQAQAVTAPPVNVVPGTPVPKPAPASSAPLLRQVLDVDQKGTLKDQMMERAIEGAR